MSNSSARATVVIPNWNGAAWIPGCLEALAAQELRDFRVILVDNGSSDDSIELARAKQPDIAVLSFARNRGFAAAVNAGIAAAETEYVALLNNDTRPRPRWLGSLVATMDAAAPDVGSLASLMLNMDRPELVDDAGDLLTRQGAARKRGHGRPAPEFASTCEVFSACAGAALYRKSFLDALHGFDERFFAYLEDVDLGLRGRLLGHRCVYVPGAEVLHRGHGSGTPHGRYIRLLTRNRLFLLYKSLPASVLRRNARHLLYGQFYFFVAQRRPAHFLAGWFDFLRALPAIRRDRKTILGSSALTPGEIEALLSPDMGEPPLFAAARRAAGGAA